MKKPPTTTPTEAIIGRLEEALGDRLVALYRFGGGFGHGPAVQDRLLLVVDRVDVTILDAVAAALGPHAAEGRVRLRVHTAESLLRGADAFPVFTLELCNTRRLLRGEDVLRDLAVDRHDLRRRLEEGLRRVYRELVQAYLDHNEDPRTLAQTLRRQTRRFVKLLEGVLHAASVEPPAPPTPSAVIEAVDRSILAGQRESLERLRAFAAFEVALESEQLSELYGEALVCLAAVIAHVDQMD